MRRFFCYLLVFSLALSVSFVSCKKEGESEGKKVIIITEIANPEEILHTLEKAIPANMRAKYLDNRAEIPTGNEIEMCFNIGARSANAVLAVYKGDFATAEKITSAVKIAAKNLNISTDEIEASASALKEAMQERDEKIRREKMTSSINTMKSRIIRTLEKINRPEFALAIQYGLWIESIRHVSGLLKDRYNAEVSGVLGKTVEAEHFKKEFEIQNSKSPSPFFADGINVAGKMANAMKATKRTLSKSAINEIFKLASDVSAKYVK